MTLLVAGGSDLVWCWCTLSHLLLRSCNPHTAWPVRVRPIFCGGSTLVKSEETDLWTVKHGPDDYKTGKSYGERPTIELRQELSEAIDDYINNWRSVLQPSTDYLFVQSRTGKPLTGDGIFQRVSRCCFKYGGKRTVSISCIFVTNWYLFCTLSCSHCMA